MKIEKFDRVQGRHEWINPIDDFAIAKYEQHKKHASGRALKGHTESAHSGTIDPKCPACRELQQKLVTTR